MVFSPVANQVAMVKAYTLDEILRGVDGSLAKGVEIPAVTLAGQPYPKAPLIKVWPQGMSLRRASMFFPLFLETEGGAFCIESNRWTKRLGFKREEQYMAGLSLLRRAGWLAAHEARGTRRWNLEKVPPEWISVLNKRNEEIVVQKGTLEVPPVIIAPPLEPLPSEMTIGGRTYEILSFLRAGESSTTGLRMVNRSKDMGAHLRMDECAHIKAFQREIPPVLRGRVIFVFTDSLYSVIYNMVRSPTQIGQLIWRHDAWCYLWTNLSTRWDDKYRILRCKRRIRY